MDHETSTGCVCFIWEVQKPQRRVGKEDSEGVAASDGCHPASSRRGYLGLNSAEKLGNGIGHTSQWSYLGGELSGASVIDWGLCSGSSQGFRDSPRPATGTPIVGRLYRCGANKCRTDIQSSLDVWRAVMWVRTTGSKFEVKGTRPLLAAGAPWIGDIISLCCPQHKDLRDPIWETLWSHSSFDQGVGKNDTLFLSRCMMLSFYEWNSNGCWSTQYWVTSLVVMEKGWRSVHTVPQAPWAAASPE